MKYTGYIDILVIKKHESSLKQYVEDHILHVEKWVKNPNLVPSVIIECALRDHPEWFDTYLSGIKE